MSNEEFHDIMKRHTNGLQREVVPLQVQQGCVAIFLQVRDGCEIAKEKALENVDSIKKMIGPNCPPIVFVHGVDVVPVYDKQPFATKIKNDWGEPTEHDRRPPLGVYPRKLWEESNPNPTLDQVIERMNDVTAAINRRVNTPHEVPTVWELEVEDRARVVRNEARKNLDHLLLPKHFSSTRCQLLPKNLDDILGEFADEPTVIQADVGERIVP